MTSYRWYALVALGLTVVCMAVHNAGCAGLVALGGLVELLLDRHYTLFEEATE